MRSKKWIALLTAVMLIAGGIVSGEIHAATKKKTVSNSITKAGTYTEVNRGNVTINGTGITLKNVSITGRLIARNTHKSKAVTLQNVKVADHSYLKSSKNTYLLKFPQKATIQSSIIKNDSVTVNGNYESLSVKGGTVTINGTVKRLYVAQSAKVILNKAKVSKLSVLGPAKNSTITVNANSSITNIVVDKKATNVKFTGKGKYTLEKEDKGSDSNTTAPDTNTPDATTEEENNTSGGGSSSGGSSGGSNGGGNNTSEADKFLDQILIRNKTKIIELGWIDYLAVTLREGNLDTYNIYVQKDGEFKLITLSKVDDGGTIGKWEVDQLGYTTIKIERKSDSKSVVYNFKTAAVVQ